MGSDVLLHRYNGTDPRDGVKRFCYTVRMIKDDAWKALLKMLAQPRTPSQWDALLEDLLTPNERHSVAERWQLVRLLSSGMPQRDIAAKLGISISKITRGSRVLQEGRGGFKDALKKV